MNRPVTPCSVAVWSVPRKRGDEPGKRGKTTPYSGWLKKLKDARAKAKVTTAIHRMRQGNFGDHKGIGEGVIEHRINYGPGYRIYYAKDGDALVILLFGGDKDSQQNDIESAQAYWSDYKNRKLTDK